MNYPLIAVWALPIVAIVLILYTRSSIKKMQALWVSPLEQIIGKQKRRAFTTVVVFGVLGWLFLTESLFILVSDGNASFGSVVVVAFITYSLLTPGIRARLAMMKIHAAFDGAIPCLPDYMAVALAGYEPKKPVTVRVAPQLGGKKVGVTVGDRYMTLIVPRRIPAEVFQLYSLVATPPSLLGFEVRWEGREEDVEPEIPTATLILPPQVESN